MKKIGILLTALTLGGCVSVRSVPTPPGALDSLHGRHLTVVTYQKPDFAAQTYGKAALGLLGAAAMITDGNAIIADNQVPDPALRISTDLASALATDIGASETARLADRNTKGDTEDLLSSDVQHNGVVLDVETINWLFVYYPLDWTHYRILMTARARIIDAQSGKRLAQAPCTYLSDDKSPPTYDELLANHAARLKAMLAAGSQSCLSKMSKDLLGG